MTQKPEIVTNEYLEYLDDLRESGDTNMFGAGAWLEAAFGLTRRDARTVLTYWMATFSERHAEEA